jgi:hypothetical protein
MTRLSILVLFVLISGLVTGCENEPFAVVAPAFRNETGTALISVSIPPFSRGLIHRVSITVSAADTERIRAIRRDMNFPIPGGNLAVSQVADIPPGRRRFHIAAFDTADTRGVPRFQGFADSTIIAGRTKLVQVTLNRVGGVVNFQAILDTVDANLSEQIFSLLPLNSVLDILELIHKPHHDALDVLPLVSVGLGDRFTTLAEGTFSRRVTVAQIPTGVRKFVAHLKDLSSNGTRAFTDTVITEIDTLNPENATFNLRPVQSAEDLSKIFRQPTLPRDSTIVVLTPQF